MHMSEKKLFSPVDSDVKIEGGHPKTPTLVYFDNIEY